MVPGDLLYTEEHEWIKVEEDSVTIGITDYATEELGEIVYVDLPSVGKEFDQMNEFGTVESVKTLSSLYIPVTGEVTAINNQTVDNPGLLNDDPFNEGWLIKVNISDKSELDELLSPEAYIEFIESL